MIGSLNGRLLEKNPTELLIECSGVGYEVKISLNTYTQLNDSEQIKLHTKSKNFLKLFQGGWFGDFYRQ